MKIAQSNQNNLIKSNNKFLIFGNVRKINLTLLNLYYSLRNPSSRCSKCSFPQNKIDFIYEIRRVQRFTFRSKREGLYTETAFRSLPSRKIFFCLGGTRYKIAVPGRRIEAHRRGKRRPPRDANLRQLPIFRSRHELHQIG